MSVVKAPAGFDPETADNFEDMEKQFAVKGKQRHKSFKVEKFPSSTDSLVVLTPGLLVSSEIIQNPILLCLLFCTAPF